MRFRGLTRWWTRGLPEVDETPDDDAGDDATVEAVGLPERVGFDGQPLDEATGALTGLSGGNGHGAMPSPGRPVPDTWIAGP